MSSRFRGLWITIKRAWRDADEYEWKDLTVLIESKGPYDVALFNVRPAKVRPMSTLLAGPCDRCGRHTATQDLRLLSGGLVTHYAACRRCLEDLEDMLAGWTAQRMDVLRLIHDDELVDLIEEHMSEPPSSLV